LSGDHRREKSSGLKYVGPETEGRTGAATKAACGPFALSAAAIGCWLSQRGSH